jgi:two-component system sensor histidine kinase KdpD
VVGDDVPEALLAFARAENATQLVLGASRRSRLAALLTGPGIGATTTRGAGDIDVHLVTHAQAGRGRVLPQRRGSLTRRRRIEGFGLAVVLPVLLTLVLSQDRSSLNLVSDVLLFLLVVVVVALVGGFLPALLAAVGGSFLLNYYFAPPLHTFTISETNNSLALAVFVVVAVLVSSVVDLAARRTRQAARATAESQTLGSLAGLVLRGETGLTAVLDQVREAFSLQSVTLLERRPRGTGGARSSVDAWDVVACAGDPPCSAPSEADVEIPAGDALMLAIRGRPLHVEDQRIVGAFAAQAAVLLERSRLAEAAAAAAPLAEADRVRTALLAAVGHDLRTPLASAKAAVESLRSTDVDWTPDDRAELLTTAAESLDRLARLVENLLDMSRLNAGAMSLHLGPVALDELVPLALDDLGGAASSVVVDVPADLPAVRADAGLLERVVANLVANAVRHSPEGRPPRLAGSVLGDRVELRVVDRGPGIAPGDLERVFAPFQRLGDTDNTTGVGLGLAISRGFVEAMGGDLTPEETPGGGLTMVVGLRAETAPEQSSPGRREREHQDAERP